MCCASNPFGCPSLAAKGRRNRLIAISQLPRHQGAISGGLSELSGKGVLVRRRIVSILCLLLAAISARTAYIDDAKAETSKQPIGVFTDDNGETIFVGIGTTKPLATLDVSRGEIKVGSTGAVCTEKLAGSLRSENAQLQFCDGAGWRNVSLDKAE